MKLRNWQIRYMGQRSDQLHAIPHGLDSVYLTPTKLEDTLVYVITPTISELNLLVWLSVV